MKKYINPESDRNQYMVCRTLNGYAIQVLVVPSNVLAALTPQVAAQMLLSLPKPYRVQCCTKQAAERQLEELAELNGLVELKTTE